MALTISAPTVTEDHSADAPNEARPDNPFLPFGAQFKASWEKKAKNDKRNRDEGTIVKFDRIPILESENLQSWRTRTLNEMRDVIQTVLKDANLTINVHRGGWVLDKNGVEEKVDDTEKVDDKDVTRTYKFQYLHVYISPKRQYAKSSR